MQRFTIEVKFDASGELSLAGILWDLSEELSWASDLSGWNTVQHSLTDTPYQYRITEADND